MYSAALCFMVLASLILQRLHAVAPRAACVRGARGGPEDPHQASSGPLRVYRVNGVKASADQLTFEVNMTNPPFRTLLNDLDLRQRRHRASHGCGLLCQAIRTAAVSKAAVSPGLPTDPQHLFPTRGV